MSADGNIFAASAWKADYVGRTNNGIVRVYSWDGSSWSEVGDLSTGRYFNTGGGTQSAGLLAGGQAGPGGTNKQDTEEFSTIFQITPE